MSGVEVPSGAPAVRTQGLVHVFRANGSDVAALRGVDLLVEPGQRIALLGPSGSGKSTLLTIVAGIVRPSAGRVEVFGVDVARASERRLAAFRGDTLGLMLQGAGTNLLLYETADANLRWSVERRGRGRVSVGARVLDAAGLGEDPRRVGAMTPSEQQVVALAVAMAALPRLLLADEPTSRLDDDARDRLLDLMVQVTDLHGTAVLMVTHDDAAASRMQRTIHLRDGRIGEEGGSAGRFVVVGADGTVQLPEALLPAWPPGSLVAIEADGSDELRMRRAGER